MKHLLLIDASGFAYRAFHAMSPAYRDDGFPTWAVVGFLSMVWRLLREAEADRPDYAAAIFDAPGPTFRHKLFPSYKGDRVKSDELSAQFPAMREAARVLGLEPIELENYEADDVIATLAAKAKKLGIRTTIVSSDKDFGQLVEDGVVEIVDPLARARIRAADVRKKFKVEPRQIADLLGLCGDSVDGIPGADGVGLKRGAGLLRQHGSIEGILKAKAVIRPAALRVAIERTGSAKLRLYRKLAQLQTNAPIKVDFESLRPGQISRGNLLVMLKWLEAEHKLTAAFGLDAKLARAVEPLPKGEGAFAWWKKELHLIKRNEERGRLPELPQCGFFQRRLVKGGPFVRARIWREPEVDFETEKPTGKDALLCEVNGERRDPFDQWGWLSQNPITEREFRFLAETHEWAMKHAPDEPEASPRKPINFATMKPPVFKRPKRQGAKA